MAKNKKEVTVPTPARLSTNAVGPNVAPLEYAQVGVANVYDSLKPLPPNTVIKSLRIIQLLPKTEFGANNPHIGYGSQKNIRAILGTVPVEADGSAFFLMPVNRPVYFQILDEKGCAVQSMRSDTYAHPGEKLMCQGCHNLVARGPGSGAQSNLAMKRAPSTIKPEPDGSYPFNYPRLVQSVLNRNCVACHAKNPKAPNLNGAPSEPHRWTTSYISLKPFAFFYDGDGWTTPLSIPGQVGARGSKLYPMLVKGHHDVKLSDEDMHRLTLWLDSNSDFFGSCADTEAQSKGEVVKFVLE